MAITLGWFSYFFIGISTGAESTSLFEMFLKSLISNLSTAFAKNLLRVSATFWLPKILASFPIRVMLGIKGAIVFQNILLSVILRVSIKILFFFPSYLICCKGSFLLLINFHVFYFWDIYFRFQIFS